MPQVRKLAPDEVQVLKNKGKGQRKLVEEQYDAILSEYDVGDYGEAVLESNEKRLTVRNRLRAAAERRNLGIKFKRATGDLLRFQIQGHNGTRHASVAVAAPEPTSQPTRRKGGRPRKAG